MRGYITPVATRVRRPLAAPTAHCGGPGDRTGSVMAEELGGEAWIAELLLDDRPGRVPEAMRCSVASPCASPSRAHRSLGAPDREPLPAPDAAVAEEEGRRVVGSRGEVGLDRRARVLTAAPLDVALAPQDDPVVMPVGTVKLQRLGNAQPVESRKAARERSWSCRSLKTLPLPPSPARARRPRVAWGGASAAWAGRW